jgi:hypothetical protein
MNTPRFAGGLTGTQTLALQAGGRDGPWSRYNVIQKNMMEQVGQINLLL